MHDGVEKNYNVIVGMIRQESNSCISSYVVEILADY